MRNKLLTVVLFISLYMLFASYNSCTSSSAQPCIDTIYYYVDTIDVKSDSFDIQKDILAVNYRKVVHEQDIVKKTVISKEIHPMQIDSVYVYNRDSLYKNLEKTEKVIQGQQRVLDSLIIIKKK